MVSARDGQPKNGVDLLESGIIGEEENASWRDGPNAAAGQALLRIRIIQDFLHDLLLSLSGGHERHAEGMVQDGVREGNPRRGRLGRVVQPRNPSVHLVQERVPGEKGARVAVRSGYGDCVSAGAETLGHEGDGEEGVRGLALELTQYREGQGRSEGTQWS